MPGGLGPLELILFAGNCLLIPVTTAGGVHVRLSGVNSVVNGQLQAILSRKMHDNLRKSEKDSTLEHSLFAAFNID